VFGDGSKVSDSHCTFFKADLFDRARLPLWKLAFLRVVCSFFSLYADLVVSDPIRPKIAGVRDRRNGYISESDGKSRSTAKK
jgi:hypothetical protein